MRCFSQNTPYQLFVGVDIAAATATIAWQTPQQKPGKSITIEQTPESFSSLHHRLMRAGSQAGSDPDGAGSNEGVLDGPGHLLCTLFRML
jgi:hypothetical protein